MFFTDFFLHILIQKFSIRIFLFLDRVITGLNKMVFVCISVCMTKKYLLESIKKDTLSGYAVAGCFNQRHKQQQISER